MEDERERVEGERREGAREREEVERNVNKGGGVQVSPKLSQIVYAVYTSYLTTCNNHIHFVTRLRESSPVRQLGRVGEKTSAMRGSSEDLLIAHKKHGGSLQFKKPLVRKEGEMSIAQIIPTLSFFSSILPLHPISLCLPHSLFLSFPPLI